MTEQAIALVTGANKGLGLETCRQLARRNITVLMGARDLQRGREAADSLTSEGLVVEPVQLDVTRADHMAQAKNLIETRFGRLDILVNNAGMIHPEEPLLANSTERVSLQALRETFEVNFFGQVALAQMLLPLIKKSPAGRIVNVSSILGSLTLQSVESYEEGNDDYIQDRALFNLFDEGQKARPFSNIAEAMQGVPQPIIKRQLGHFEKVHPDYAAGVRQALEKMK